MSGLLVLLLFTVFAVCVLSVLLTGAGTYRDLTARNHDSYDRRTAVQYLTTKIRQNDGDEMLFVGGFQSAVKSGRGDTLYLKEHIDGEVYYTCVYCHGGYVRELFVQSGVVCSPEDGERILPAQSLNFAMEEGRIIAQLKHLNGQRDRIVVELRSWEVSP